MGSCISSFTIRNPPFFPIIQHRPAGVQKEHQRVRLSKKLCGCCTAKGSSVDRQHLQFPAAGRPWWLIWVQSAAPGQRRSAGCGKRDSGQHRLPILSFRDFRRREEYPLCRRLGQLHHQHTVYHCDTSLLRIGRHGLHPGIRLHPRNDIAVRNYRRVVQNIPEIGLCPVLLR